MKNFSKIFYTLIAFVSFVWTGIFSLEIAFAQPSNLLLNADDKSFIELPNGSSGSGIVDFLGFIQSVLLKLILPLVAIGCGLYIAYTLFTAEWDEWKMKKVWSALVYSIVGIISIMLSYFVVDLISRIQIG